MLQKGMGNIRFFLCYHFGHNVEKMSLGVDRSINKTVPVEFSSYPLTLVFFNVK